MKTRTHFPLGSVLVAPALLKEIKVGERSVRDVPAAVFPGNKLQVGLLGMTFSPSCLISRWPADARSEAVKAGRFSLFRRHSD